MRGDANRRRTDFRPANLPLADGPSPEGPAAGDMHRILPRVAGCTVLRIIVRSDAFGALGDAWDPQATIARSMETKTLAQAAADCHPHVQNRGRPDLNSSFASFQSPSGDFAIPLI